MCLVLPPDTRTGVHVTARTVVPQLAASAALRLLRALLRARCNNQAIAERWLRSLLSCTRSYHPLSLLQRKTCALVSLPEHTYRHIYFSLRLHAVVNHNCITIPSFAVVGDPKHQSPHAVCDHRMNRRYVKPPQRREFFFENRDLVVDYRTALNHDTLL